MKTEHKAINVTNWTEVEMDALFAAFEGGDAVLTKCRPEVVAAIMEFCGLTAPAYWWTGAPEKEPKPPPMADHEAAILNEQDENP